MPTMQATEFRRLFDDADAAVNSPWYQFTERWAQEHLERLQEHHPCRGEAYVPLPTFAVRFVRAAIREVQATNRRLEQEVREAEWSATVQRIRR